MSQAEHGTDSQVVLLAINLTADHLQEIERQVDVQAKALPRVDIIREAIKKSLIVTVKTVEDAIKFSNDYAPEHLILHLEDAPGAVKEIENAGSIFVGPFSPERCVSKELTVLCLLAVAVAITLLVPTTHCPPTVTPASSPASTLCRSRSTSLRRN